MLQHFDRERLIWEASVSSAQKILLLALNSFVDAHGQCWPGYARLSAMCGMSERTVMRTAQSLETLGILAIERRRKNGHQSSNLYRVDFEKLRVTICQAETPQGDMVSGWQGDMVSGWQGDMVSPDLPSLDLPSKELPRSSSSSDRDLGEKQPTNTTPEDPFFSSRKPRRIEMVATTPRWDQNAPWENDEQRKEFDTWLQAKYRDKDQPARYAAVIVRSAARGEPCVDWNDFATSPQIAIALSQEPQVLAEWGGREDWENFPLLKDWRSRYESLGWMKFVNLGGRYSPQHRFADWARERARLVV